MRIIGSKQAKMQQIIKVLRESVSNFELMMHTGFYDVFSGIGCVSSEMMKYGRVVASDNFYPFYLITYAQVYPALEESQDFYTLSMLVRRLNEGVDAAIGDSKGCPRESGGFIKQFSRFYGREFPYYTYENAIRIAYYREYIEQMKQQEEINDSQYRYLLGLLLSECLYVAQIRLSFDTPISNKETKYQFSQFRLSELKFKPTRSKRSSAACVDFLRAASEIKGGILYLDPPANSKQYGTHYFLLDVIARKEVFKPDLKSGGNREHFKTLPVSTWSKTKCAWSELNNIMQHHNADYVVMTYAKNGIIPEDEIERIFLRNGDSQFYRKVDLGNENLFIIKKVK